MRFRAPILILSALLLTSHSATLHAQAIPVQNAGFELPVLSDGQTSGVNAPLALSTSTFTTNNWTMSATTLLAVPILVPARVEIINPTGSGPVNIAGNQLAILRANGLVGVGTFGTITQDLGVSFVGNTRYTLTANLGLETLASALSDFGMNILAGTNIQASRDKSTILSLFLNSDQLYQVSMSFTTPAVPPSGNINVQFYESSLAGVAGAFMVDSVSVTAVAVPEPTTIAMIALSASLLGAGFARYRWNLRKQLDAAI